jgi:segregation and condensation protein B
MENLIPKLEALLFIYGEALTYKKIAKFLDISAEEAKELAKQLDSRMKERSGGLALLMDEGKIQLATRPDFGKFLEKVVKKEFDEDLSPASLETVSIIAYAAPITRSEIEYIRGVNSSFTLRSLMLRGLIERSPDPRRPNAFIYSPNFDFLKHLGIARKEDLPEFEKMRNLMSGIRNRESITYN